MKKWCIKNNGVGIILVDVQERLLSAIETKDYLIDALILLIQSIKIFKIPLIVTEQVPDKLGATSEILLSYLSNSDRIAKSSFSVFGSPQFIDALNSQKLKHLILTGVETPICIYLSAIDALKQGYEVTILSDCVGARRSEDQEVIFGKLERAGCHIIPLESFLYGFLGSAEHADFGDINQLVRNRNANYQ